MEKINFTVEDARAYVAEYIAKFPQPELLEFIQVVDTGQRIRIKNMTDAEAFIAAHSIWQNVDLPFFIHLRSTGQMQ